MMELTVGNYKQDSNRLQLSVTNAIDDIHQISNLKITDQQKPNFLQNYLPQDDFETPVNNFGSVRDKRSVSLVAIFIHWLTKDDEFWPLLDIQYRQNKNVTFCHKKLTNSGIAHGIFHPTLDKVSKSQTQKLFHP